MSKEVNLISSRRKGSSSTYKRIGLIRTISFVVLGLCVLITFVLIFLNNTSQLGSLTQKEQELDKTLLQSKNKIVKLALIKDRLASIKTLVLTSTTYETTIDSLSQALPRDESFDTFQISNTKVNLVVSSASLLSINTFLDYIITNVNNKKMFQKATVSSLVGDIQTGRYVLTVDIILL